MPKELEAPPLKDLMYRGQRKKVLDYIYKKSAREVYGSDKEIEKASKAAQTERKRREEEAKKAIEQAKQDAGRRQKLAKGLRKYFKEITGREAQSTDELKIAMRASGASEERLRVLEENFPSRGKVKDDGSTREGVPRFLSAYRDPEVQQGLAARKVIGSKLYDYYKEKTRIRKKQMRTSK